MPLGCGYAHTKGWVGLWLTQSDARYLCGQRHRVLFHVAGILFPCLYPPKKKILMPPPIRTQFLSSHFRVNKKAATPHHEEQEDFLPFKISQCYVTTLSSKPVAYTNRKGQH